MSMTDEHAASSADVHIGDEFTTGAGRFRVTDVGSRVIVAIRVDRVKTNDRVLPGPVAEEHGWFNGPPYAVAEIVFDEDDMHGIFEVHRGAKA